MEPLNKQTADRSGNEVKSSGDDDTLISRHFHTHHTSLKAALAFSTHKLFCLVLTLSALALVSCGQQIVKPVTEEDRDSVVRNRFGHYINVDTEAILSGKVPHGHNHWELYLGKPPADPHFEATEIEHSVRLIAPRGMLSTNLLSAFETRQFLKAELVPSGSDQALYEQIRAADVSAVALVPSHMVARLLAEDLILRIPSEKISDLQYLIWSPPVGKRSHRLRLSNVNGHSIPYLWTCVGLAYNRGRIPSELATWGTFWHPDSLSKEHAKDLHGRVARLSEPRDVISSALIFLGYSANSDIESELDEARALFEAEAPNFTTDDDVLGGLIKNRIWLAQVRANTATLARRENPAIEFLLPEGGTHLNIYSLVILKESKVPEHATEVLKFLIDTKQAAEISNENCYASSNARTKPYIDIDLLLGAAYQFPPPENYHILQANPSIDYAALVNTEPDERPSAK